MSDNHRKKIAVFGHYGNQNLGDEAIIEAVIGNCRKRHPDAEIICISIDPKDSAKRHAVDAFPLRVEGREWMDYPRYRDLEAESVSEHSPGLKALLKRRLPVVFYLLKIAVWYLQLPFIVIEQLKFSRQNYKLLKTVDYLLVSGSNQFLDNFGGAWGFPYSLLNWTLLAKLSGTKVNFISVGAGPLDGFIGKKFVKWVLKLSDYYSFRDIGSYDLVSRFYPAVSKSVYPDLAFSLMADSIGSQKSNSTRDRRLVGINPMPVYDPRYWPIADIEKYNRYIEQIAAFSAWLLDKDYEVCFFSTQPKDGNVIVDIRNLLQQRYSRHTHNVRAVISESVSGLLKSMSEFDLLIATRFHGVLLSLFLGKPVAAICYGQKTHDLMQDCGLGKVACDLDSIAVENLQEYFQIIESDAEHIEAMLADKQAEYSRQLAEQYDAVLDLQRI
ncbi:MAG: polysaccharide pyruvyl transferase family protein [Gammaproteobacteria bacterium]|nr:polysaccharide pyruvyl transferase family protein [Gammaproteobacteria bacterium]